jgi:hypothetical protein
MLVSYVKNVAISAIFIAAILTMFLPFYGFLDVSEIPGIAAIVDHKNILSHSGLPIFSNRIVFLCALIIYNISVWWARCHEFSTMAQVSLRLLPICILEIGKWEFLLLHFEHNIKYALYGFWLNSFVNLVLLIVNVVLLYRKLRKAGKTARR